MPSEVNDKETIRDWDKVQENAEDITEKLKVPGGWLYRTRATNASADRAMALVFVPGK